MRVKHKDIAGQRFGNLTAIRRCGTSKNGNAIWLCNCDCGNTREVIQYSLTRPHRGTRSCGHLTMRAKGQAAFNELYSTYRHNAVKRGLEWSLSKDDFRRLTSSNCKYCGKEPSQNIRKSGRYGVNGVYIYNGIDRMDNSIGYTNNNCVSACKDCNIGKGTKSMSEFYAWIFRVFSRVPQHKVA